MTVSTKVILVLLFIQQCYLCSFRDLCKLEDSDTTYKMFRMWLDGATPKDITNSPRHCLENLCPTSSTYAGEYRLFCDCWCASGVPLYLSSNTTVMIKHCCNVLL